MNLQRAVDQNPVLRDFWKRALIIGHRDLLIRAIFDVSNSFAEGVSIKANSFAEGVSIKERLADIV